MSMPGNKLLIVDDDPGIRELLSDFAAEIGFDVETAGDAEQFLKCCRTFQPAVVIIDLVMPGADGIEILRSMAQRGSTAQVIVMSGLDEKVLKTAKRIGAHHGFTMLGALTKPIDLDVLERLLLGARRDDEPISEQTLGHAIENGELILHYQPKVKLAQDGSLPLDGVEALVRWQSPTMGLVSPARFIPVAEKCGLIGELTGTVFRMAADQAAAWKADGMPMSVAINLAPALLQDIGLPDRMAKELALRSLSGDSLVLEITESGTIDDGLHVTDVLTRFRLKGIGLSLDDFGTGYSSLVQLYRMPFSELKIDQSFVSRLDDDDEARIIVRSIVDLARNLGLSTCAEGVETAGGLAFLRHVGCDKIQGYLISKPLPAPDIADFISRWQRPETAGTMLASSA